MPGKQMIVVRNEYLPDEIAINEQNSGTEIEPIEAEDITQGERYKILNSSVWGLLEENYQIPAFIITMLSSCGALMGFILSLTGELSFVPLIFIGLFFATAPLGAPPLIYRFLVKPKKLKKPLIKTEGLFAKIIDAFNQRVKMFNSLEEGEISEDEQAELAQKLNALGKVIQQNIEDFRKIRKNGKDIEESKHTPLKALPADTTEIDVVLEAGLIAKKDITTDMEQALEGRLQFLMAEMGK